LDGLSKPDKIAKRIVKIESDACALTDHGNISGSVAFLQKMKDAKKKPILGCELYVSKDRAEIQNEENRKMSHLPILAKNDRGWKQLIKITSECNQPHNFYYKPRLSLEQLTEYFDGSIMAFSGHLGSDISNCIINRDDSVNPNWEKDATNLALWFRDALGKDNFRLEAQLMDRANTPTQVKLVDMIRQISKKTGIPVIATPDAHYASREDAVDQRILLCTNMHVTMQQAQRPDFMLNGFFKSDHFHIPSYDEMIAYGHTQEELDNTVEVASFVEEYKNILTKPILSPFPCPDGLNPDEFLRRLCQQGWARLVKDRVPKSEHQRYADRVKYELGVLQGAGLSSYFLIVQDIVNFVRSKGWLPGPGRGSAAGCLVSYLVGITSIDPIPYDLIFERFYNAGRNTADYVSMPDIDVDIPVTKREEVIEYIRRTYGKDRVSQMITFQTIKGRGAMKDVLRAYGDVSFEEMNRITACIPDEAKIADDLQVMKEETGESSIIRWALENNADKLSEWCALDENDQLTGPLADRFAQAIRLEGTKSNQSKHASGIVIAPETLSNVCPMIYDSKNKTQVAGLEMADLESIGMIKFDILGVAVLDKVMGVADILKFEDITHCTNPEEAVEHVKTVQSSDDW
jgi:DNA polymerase-3 subunit alpha